MFNKTFTVFAAAIALPGLLTSVGCLRAAAELAEEAFAEAIVTQSISSYNEVAVDVAVNDAALALSCNSGGSVEWGDETESADEFCYSVDSRGCDFETGAGRSFAIEGSSDICGSDSFDVSEGTLAADQDFKIDGSATVTTDQGERTCDYSLDVSVGSIREESSGAVYSISVTGELCDRRAFSTEFDVAVEGNVTVSAQ